jgi:hypothetical protein
MLSLTTGAQAADKHQKTQAPLSTASITAESRESRCKRAGGSEEWAE